MKKPSSKHFAYFLISFVYLASQANSVIFIQAFCYFLNKENLTNTSASELRSFVMQYLSEQQLAPGDIQLFKTLSEIHFKLFFLSSGA